LFVQQIYHKLVRDRIPEIIRANDSTCEIEVMDEEAYQQALRQKLVEEAQETATADEQHLITELADLYEVIDALLSCYHIAPSQVRDEQIQRRTARGGFSQRIRLLSTSPMERSDHQEG
jgi:predicted house-cleaning noncanonical NTP pyrophosphatase (MazG superfamily)